MDLKIRIITYLRIKYLEDTMWGMQIYIAEHTGNTMDEKKLDWYREYWKRK